MTPDPTLSHDWHPVASMRQLNERNPLAVRLLGEDLVIWRSGTQIMAWRDLCVHRGTQLSLGKIQGDCLECPYHGWTYNSEGRCVHMPAHPEQTPPAKAQTLTYAVKVQYDLVWVCLDQPQNSIGHFPEWTDDSFRKILCGPYHLNASGPRIIENFLDVGHFPFVHENILGTRSRPEIADYDVTTTDEGVIAENVRVYQPNGYGTGEGAVVQYTYKALRPLTAYLAKESTGPRFGLILMVTPHGPVESTAWMWMAMNYAHEQPETELVAWQDSIFWQDAPILRSQRPELLPTDLQSELHLRSDRTAIAYRSWLRQMGL